MVDCGLPIIYTTELQEPNRSSFLVEVRWTDRFKVMRTTED